MIKKYNDFLDGRDFLVGWLVRKIASKIFAIGGGVIVASGQTKILTLIIESILKDK